MTPIIISIIIAFIVLVVVLIVDSKEERANKKQSKNNKYNKPFFNPRKWFKPPKYHNIITTTIRLSVFSVGFIIITFIFLFSREIFPRYIDIIENDLRNISPHVTINEARKIASSNAIIGGLIETIRFIVLCTPTFAFVMHLIRKIKVGQHYSERNKKIKKMIKLTSDNTDYISEIERLANLKNKGIITEEEYEAKKKELLDL